MLFKKIILLTLISAVFVGCSNESEPRHQKAIAEEDIRPSEVESSLHSEESKNNRYNENHYKILHTLSSPTVENLEGVYNLLQKQLFGKNLQNKEIYIQSAYGGYLELFVKAYSMSLKSDSPSAELLAAKMRAAFYENYIQDCVEPERQECELLKNALFMEKTTADLIFEIAKNTKNAFERIKMLGAAFDLKSRRENVALENLYTDSALEALAIVENGNGELDKKRIQKHLRNLLILNANTNWLSAKSELVKRFEVIEPWKYQANSGKILDDLRKELVSFLPVYAARSSRVKEGIVEVVKKRLQELDQNNKDLSKYPAFSDISLKSLIDLDVAVSFLAIELYFKNMAVTDANTYVRNVRNKGAFVDQLFLASKTLIRWDMAQLSITSTEKIKEKFTEQDTKTNAFFQETLKWAESLIPLWTEFHSLRVWAIKSLLDSSIHHSETIGEEDVRHFFSAINRNILKTTVYPNMMAFGYHMSKTEWNATIELRWGRIKLDTTLLMDFMMTGRFENPWFNFTNLREAKGWRLEEKKSLYRTDMLEALHYFFSTKTFETYEINPDEFLKITIDTIFKKRRSNYEKLLDTQKNVYLSENTTSGLFINWCEGMKAGKPVEESLSFYFSHMYLLPFNKELTYDEMNRTRSLYYGDWFQTEFGSGESSMTTLDRYRLEFLPIFGALKQYKEITERVASANPELGIGRLEKSKELIADIELLSMKFLGLQKLINNKMEGCLFVAHDEVRRRAKASALAHIEYFMKVVHPLMKQVKDGQLTLEEANSVIQDFHGNQAGVQDEIVVDNSGAPSFIINSLAYFLRNRMFLISGIVFNHPALGNVKIDAIVGPHLEITVPTNYLSDRKNNPFIGRVGTAQNYIKVEYRENPSDLAEDLTVITTDESRGAIMSRRFTQWDQHDAVKYAEFFQEEVEFQAIMYQIPDQKFLDIEKPGCFVNDPKELKEECIRSEKASIVNLLTVVERLFEAYRLDKDDQEYFSLTNLQGWISGYSMSIVAQMDSTIPYDYNTNTLPYKRPAGVFDYVRELLNSDYLGLSFQTEWELELEKGSDRPGDYSCEGTRNGCYWKNERYQALEFFYARDLKPKLIFKMDTQIIEDDYRIVKRQVEAKMNRVMDLEVNRDIYLEEIFSINNKLSEKYRLNMFFEPTLLVPLSLRFLNYDKDMEKFFDEELEGFYSKEHQWDQHIIY